MPHRFVTAKSPVTCVLIFVSALSPLFVTVTCCAALVVPIVCAAKVSAVVLNASVGLDCPFPLNSAVCVPASSVATMLPDDAPEAVGEKTTPTVQLVFTASDEPHVFAEMLKGPLIVSGFSPAGAAPVFATVMYCTGLVWLMRTDPKSSRNGVSTIVPPCVPVPRTLAVSTPPCTFAATVTAPLRGPVAVGANTIKIAHDAPGSKLAGHGLLNTKSSSLTAAAQSVSATLPVLRMVRLSAALVVPTACEANGSVAGVIVAVAT